MLRSWWEWQPFLPHFYPVDILLHRQATQTENFDGQCILTNSNWKGLFMNHEKINPFVFVWKIPCFFQKLHNFIFYFWLKIAA